MFMIDPESQILEPPLSLESLVYSVVAALFNR